MTDKEIFEVTDRAIERYSKMTNEFISAELDALRHEMKGLKEEFAAMNGRLRDVCQWKDQHEGEQRARDKGLTKHLQIAGVVIAFIGVFSTMFIGFKKMGIEVDTIKKGVLLQNEMTLEERGFYPPGQSRGYADSALINNYQNLNK